MNRTRPPLLKVWHQLRARPRLIVSAIAGVLAFCAMPQLALTTRALLTWDVGAGLYLLLAFVLFARASTEHMRWRARMQDDGAAAVLFLTIAAAIASLVAIAAELSGLKTASAELQGLHLALVAVTFMASWLLVHTAFALHYAHAYYVALGGDGHAPLEFPRQIEPVYGDFLYFSIVVGMTSQTADVAIASTPMRRLVMMHGIVAFVFNTTLLALTINIAASLLG